MAAAATDATPWPERLDPRLAQPMPIRRCDWPACGAACCFQGVWVDEAEIEDILRHASQIQPYLEPEDRDPEQWFEATREPDPHSLSGWVRPARVRDAAWHPKGTRCIFLRRDARCALQVAALAAGEHPWRWKPFYCILHPLDLDAQGRITLPPWQELVAEPASCVRPSDQPHRPVELFREEIRYLTGFDPMADASKQTGRPNPPSASA
ncbi:MAG: DUF3109 family protein [Chloroflexi bacterium]|nr:DUF3109 family protein [Chloroflexota bacterium]